MRQLFILLILFGAFYEIVFGQAVKEDSSYKNKYLVLPVIASSPESSIMLGGVVIRQFKPSGAGPGTRSSNLLISAIYTFKKQNLCSFLPEIILPGETWIFSGNHYVNYFPEKFWGIGPDTKRLDELTVLYTQINIEQAFLRRIMAHLYAGPQIRWSRLSGVRFTNRDAQTVKAPDVNGSYGSISSGFGFIVRWDKRNSILNPTRNHYLDLSLLFSPSFTGTNYPFTSVQIDVRKYVGLGRNGKTILAFQNITRLTTGSPAFRDLSMIGGDVIMRGYYEGRFRDKNASQIQVEVRQNIIGRLGFTFFTGIGSVWKNFRDNAVTNFKWTSGLGLRFDLNPRDTNNLRLDFGMGSHTSGFYLMFGEAF